MTALLEVSGLHKSFAVKQGLLRGRQQLRAVSDLSLTLAPGEALGIVGESGCGKTTLARMLVWLTAPDAGSIVFDGDALTAAGNVKSFRKDVQMVFQNPYESLNPRKTIRHILTQPFTTHGICSGKDAEVRAIELLEKVGLRPGRQFLDRYPHQFSGGQRQRIGIARALALKPRLIIADEPVSSLDVSVRGEILNLLKDLQREFALSYIFISHDLSIVRSFCDRVLVMYLGRIVEEAPIADLFNAPRHPYTRALMSAIPTPDPVQARSARRIVLSGDIPSPVAPPPGCAFHTRCQFATERCSRERPLLSGENGSHRAACHHVDRVLRGIA
ncbi:MAG TPA: oligopeptide/dipeptide ABC transporter ATP-binding protein [Pseudolabrys sp.]|nr:oligopeptide/dipeptide ABC transporter ATP-binding protein [Pseudolabrys sp.]